MRLEAEKKADVKDEHHIQRTRTHRKGSSRDGCHRCAEEGEDCPQFKSDQRKSLKN